MLEPFEIRMLESWRVPTVHSPEVTSNFREWHALERCNVAFKWKDYYEKEKNFIAADEAKVRKALEAIVLNDEVINYLATHHPVLLHNAQLALSDESMESWLQK